MTQSSDNGSSPDGPAGFAVEVGDAREGVIMVMVSGAVDLQTAPQVSDALAQAQQRATAVGLDLRQVEFLGSAGLSALVDAARRSDETGGRLAILATNHAVMRAVQVTGLDEVLRVFADPGETQEFLRG